MAAFCHENRETEVVCKESGLEQMQWGAGTVRSEGAQSSWCHRGSHSS